MTAQGGVVLDASAALAWALRDADAEFEATLDLLMTDGFLLVPELWHAEMANALRTALRVGRVSTEFVSGLCEQLEYLDIRTDVVGCGIRRLALQAHTHGLSAYDTAYLLLAKDRGLPLATFDRHLAAAAVDAQIPLVIDMGSTLRR